MNQHFHLAETRITAEFIVQYQAMMENLFCSAPLVRSEDEGDASWIWNKLTS